MRICISIFLLISAISLSSQDLQKYEPIRAEIRGGLFNLDQALQTQLTLPKNCQNKYWQSEFNVFFLLDSLGHAKNLLFKDGMSNPQLQREMRRFFYFLQFSRVDIDPQIPYFLSFSLSGEKYQAYQKQKLKSFIKSGTLADSSMVIYSRSDKSPEYFKGEEALKEMLMTELEYPKLALEKSVQGTVVLEFIVETNGYITSINVKQPVGAGCSEEAIRLIRKTRWQPAEMNGKLVRYKMSYPITFGLRNTTRDSGF